MTVNFPEEMGGFKVLLYGLFHIKDIKSHPAFDSRQADKVLNNYGPEKVRIIIQGLEWAVKNRDVDYQSIFPGMRYSNEEILWYFDKTLKEMMESDLLEKIDSLE